MYLCIHAVSFHRVHRPTANLWHCWGSFAYHSLWCLQCLNADILPTGLSSGHWPVFKDLSDILERCAKYTQLYIVGDINVHLDNPSCTHTCRLKQLMILMNDFELRDPVRQLTHISQELTTNSIFSWRATVVTQHRSSFIRRCCQCIIMH